MARRWLTAAERIQAAKARTFAELRAEIKAPLPPGASMTPAFQVGVLRSLRLLGSVLKLPARQANLLRNRMRAGLAQVFGSMKLRPKDLGGQSPEQLAEVFLQMIERTSYGGYTARELRSKAKGLRGTFFGELLERLVLNLEDLQEDFTAMAQGQLAELRSLAKARSPLLVNALGDPVTLTGRWGRVRRATSVWIWRRDAAGKLTRKKATDLLHVSEFSGMGPPTVGMLVETEIKATGAAKELGPQIGDASRRYQGAEMIEMLLEGDTEPIFVNPERLIYSQRSVQRTGVTLTSRRTDQYRFSTSRDTREVYLRAALAIKSDILYKLVRLVFPR